MIIDIASIAWVALSCLIFSIALALIFLFLSDKDFRKLMIGLGILPSGFSFIYLAVQYPPPILPNGTITYFIFRWGIMPPLISIFFIFIDRLFYKKSDFKILFSMFMFFYVFSFILIISNRISSDMYGLISSIASALIIILCIYMVVKVKELSSWLFLFSICVFVLGGYSIDSYLLGPSSFSNTALPMSCFFIGYIFLGLIFGHNVFSQYVDDEGIGIYFNLKNKLRKVEAELQKSQQQYSQVVENLHQGLFIIDEKAKIVYSNPYFAEMLGFTPPLIQGKNIFIFMDVRSENNVKKSLDTKEPTLEEELEINLIKKDKAAMPAMLFITPLIDKNDNKIGLLAAVQDISNRKRIEHQLHEKIFQLQKNEHATLNIMEDLQETILDLQKAKEEINQKNKELKTINAELNTTKNQLALLNKDLETKVKQRTGEVEMLLKQKDDFINQLGHDLKTPLTPLNTLLPLIRQREQDTKRIELLDICINNVNFMRNLVMKTLELAKLNAKSSFLHVEDMILYDEVNEVLQSKKLMFLDKNITVFNNISKQLIVQADSIQMKELFDNIIVNAVNYSAPLENQITIDAKEEENQVIVTIKDNGIGLKFDQLEAIFNEFYKADTSRHRLESTGLGLSICKRIVEKHGGKIWAESPGLGKGSTFYFTLPLNKKKIIES
jgi:PAS domain S-box-containing protein